MLILFFVLPDVRGRGRGRDMTTSRLQKISGLRILRKTTGFNIILDKAIQSLEPRFKQLEENNSLFNVFYNFKSLDSVKIRESADKLENSLTSSSDQSSDVCGRKLADEIVALKSFLPDTVKQPLDILKYLSSNKRYTAFPNYFVALRIF